MEADCHLAAVAADNELGLLTTVPRGQDEAEDDWGAT